MSRFGIGVVCFLFATNAFAADEGQRRSGFVFRGGLGSRFLALTGDASPATSFSGLSAELSIGWKLDRVLVTVGFELGNITTSTGNSTFCTAMNL